jgi:hypothetical protein
MLKPRGNESQWRSWSYHLGHVRTPGHLKKWRFWMVFGLQSPPRTFFLFLAMELRRSVQQLLCHQFNLAPTRKARIIYVIIAVG